MFGSESLFAFAKTLIPIFLGCCGASYLGNSGILSVSEGPISTVTVVNSKTDQTSDVTKQKNVTSESTPVAVVKVSSGTEKERNKRSLKKGSEKSIVATTSSKPKSKKEVSPKSKTPKKTTPVQSQKPAPAPTFAGFFSSFFKAFTSTDGLRAGV